MRCSWCHRFQLLSAGSSLRLRLLAAYVAACLIVPSVVALAVWAVPDTADLKKPHMADGVLQFLSQRLVLDVPPSDAPAATPSTPQPRMAWTPDDDLLWLLQAYPNDVRFRVLDSAGAVLLRSDPVVPPAPSADTPGFAHVRSRTVVRDGHTLVLEVALSERIARFAQVQRGPQLAKSMVLVAVAGVLVFMIAVWFTLRRLLAPLQRASQQAATIHLGNLQTRLDVQSLPRELQPLVVAFNQTMDRLEEGFTGQQQLLADTAHELKTPLALLRGQIEMDGLADRAILLQDIDQLSRQVQQFLALAETSEARNFKITPVNPVAVAEQTLAYLQRLALQHQVTLALSQQGLRHKSGQPGITWPALQADGSALFVLLKNLLENAIQHSPPGGVVSVELTAERISIKDQGPGIPEAHREAVFQRFWRDGRSRNQRQGAGLGLAICRQIAHAHGWHLAALRSLSGAVFVLSWRGECMANDSAPFLQSRP